MSNGGVSRRFAFVCVLIGDSSHVRGLVRCATALVVGLMEHGFLEEDAGNRHGNSFAMGLGRVCEWRGLEIAKADRVLKSGNMRAVPGFKPRFCRF